MLGTYYQTGKTDNNLFVGAYMLNAYGEIHNEKLFAGAGVDYLSGSSDKTSSSRSKSFSTLYATNHKFYGYMDYFLNIPVDAKQRGLIDPYLRFGITPSKNFKTTVDVHHFYLANENNPGGSKKIQKRLGDEADLLLEYQPSEVINFQAGYSMMFATENMELIKGGSKSNYNGWAFVMVKISPSFFTQESKK